MSRTKFKTWLSGYRNQYHYLDFSFHEPVVVLSDTEGRGGTVGLTIKWKAQGKSDGALYESKLIGIFEVTWFDDLDREFGGRRMITSGTGAIGAITPLL
jgi:hypothetical protein